MRTLQEVAEIMTARGYPMTVAGVSNTEQRALRKLRTLLGGVTDSSRQRRRVYRSVKAR